MTFLSLIIIRCGIRSNRTTRETLKNWSLLRTLRPSSTSSPFHTLAALNLIFFTTMLSEKHSALLARALAHQKPFHCEGIWKFPAEQLQLFYRTESDVRYIFSHSAIFRHLITRELHSNCHCQRSSTLSSIMSTRRLWHQPTKRYGRVVPQSQKTGRHEL